MDRPAIRSFTPQISDASIENLLARLKTTRFPDAETVEDWSQGLPLSYQQELLDYWRDDYDFSRVANRLSEFDNFLTEIEGIDLFCLQGLKCCLVGHDDRKSAVTRPAPCRFLE